MPNYQKPLILLGHFDFSPAKHPLQKNFFSPIFTPAVRGLTHPRAPFRAFSRPFASFRAAIPTPTRAAPHCLARSANMAV